MTRSLVPIAFIFLTACSDKISQENTTSFPEPVVERKIELVDSLGSVVITLPARYDTNVSWIHWSDCGKECAKQKYRLQPKRLRITKESGFYFTGEPTDSIERFSIVHGGWIRLYEHADSSLIIADHQRRKVNFLADPATYKMKTDIIEKINDRYFSIFLIDLFDSTKRQYSKKLLTDTSVKGNMIEFNFELLTKKNDSLSNKFLENSKVYLRSLRLSKGI